MERDGFQGAGFPSRSARVGLAFLRVVTLVACVLLAGCGSSGPVEIEEDASRQNLQRIGVAYAQVSAKLGRPPRDMQELSDGIAESPERNLAGEILRSPNDGEEYVVVLDVDFRQLAMSRGNVDVVIAYEKRGKNGRRYVLKPPTHVVVMSDEEFKAASFPPGHQPAP